MHTVVTFAHHDGARDGIHISKYGKGPENDSWQIVSVALEDL
jgi:hypothetical protein